MLSCFLSVPARCTRHPARSRRLHAGARAVDVAPSPQALVQGGIRPESLPRHVAVVTDGNRRWAQARGMPTAEGHEAGRRALERAIWLSHAWGIRALTVFAFSQENFGRPKVEVDYLMGMIERTIRDNVDGFARAREAKEATRHNSQFHLMLATCYSGRWDIVRACRELAGEVQSNLLRPEDIDESSLATSVAAGGELTCPDLVIRTSGEVRLSNFLMWQSAYSELYFTDVVWPDFGEAEYLQALTRELPPHHDALRVPVDALTFFPVRHFSPHAAAPRVQRGIQPESLPRHVAVVMDGNRRWAQARGMLTTAEGHDAGRRALERTIWLSHAWGIRVLTVFAFSQENFGRPKMEVDCLMGIIEKTIRDNLDEYARNGIRLHVIGDPTRRPSSLQNTIQEAEETTRNKSQLHLILATCYSGQWDIVQACRALAREVQGETLRPEDIDEALLASRLATSDVAGEFSSPDLIIRTSGELRLSNFLMWQSAYSELYFTDTLWPDFGEAEYLQALSSFQSRERRFGVRNA